MAIKGPLSVTTKNADKKQLRLLQADTSSAQHDLHSMSAGSPKLKVFRPPPPLVQRVNFPMKVRHESSGSISPKLLTDSPAGRREIVFPQENKARILNQDRQESPTSEQSQKKQSRQTTKQEKCLTLADFEQRFEEINLVTHSVHSRRELQIERYGEEVKVEVVE